MNCVPYPGPLWCVCIDTILVLGGTRILLCINFLVFFFGTSFLKVTPRVEVHHSAEGANAPTSVSQEMVNGDAPPEETRILPVIEGCSRSFVEDLAAVPSAEVWSDGELGMLPLCRTFQERSEWLF